MQRKNDKHLKLTKDHTEMLGRNMINKVPVIAKESKPVNAINSIVGYHTTLNAITNPHQLGSGYMTPPVRNRMMKGDGQTNAIIQSNNMPFGSLQSGKGGPACTCSKGYGKGAKAYTTTKVPKNPFPSITDKKRKK